MNANHEGTPGPPDGQVGKGTEVVPLGKCQLLPHHEKLLRESVIHPVVVTLRGYRSVTVKRELAELGFSRPQQNVPALLIPLHGVAGGVVGYQVRPDHPRVIKGKTLKYENPVGGRIVLDVPPASWKDLDDPGIPLWITEGSRKADAAVSAGLCCISVPGVWGWRGTNSNGGKAALPDWENVALNGRRVFLAFDSDAMTKTGVHLALDRLKGFLTSRGAKVKIIHFPHGQEGGKIGLDDFLAAGHSSDDLLALAREEMPVLVNGNPAPAVSQSYFFRDGCTWRNKPTREGGAVPVRLANFAARIVAQERFDDGAEVSAHFSLSGEMVGGRQLPLARVSAEGFSGMAWVLPELGARAVVQAGTGTRDHLRAAIQELSGEVPTETVYQHLGWRLIGEGFYYLHADGAIGAAGPGQELRVEPEVQRLRQYLLPQPPTGQELSQAVRSSLALFELAPPAIMIPILAGVYRAPFSQAFPTDFALFLSGQSGTQKTELTALAQAHWGREFSGRNLPANWSATANTLERLAFLAKDAVLVVDDFYPGGSLAEVQKLNREADRLFRGQGNRAGWGRMRVDGSLRPENFPRGLIISSGEDTPSGQSLRARLLILEIKAGDVDLARLTSAQNAAAEGTFAAAMAGFVRWVAARMAELPRTLPSLFRELRQAARADQFAHDRHRIFVPPWQKGRGRF